MKLNIRGPVPPDEGASSSASPSGEGSSVSKEKAPEHSSNSGSIDEDISAPEVTQEQEGTTATTTVVPGKAPYFQWEGMVFNENRVSFKTIEDCVERFESVLTAYRVEIEDNWRRILPTGLSGSVAKWYASFGEITLWEEFKTIVIKKYGRSQADTKDEAREKLENLIFRKGLLPTVFLEEFQNLKTAADIKDEDCLVHYLFKTLPKDLSAATKFYINKAASKAEIDINFVISRAVATYEALFKAEWENEEAKRGSDHRGYTSQRGSNFREGQGTKFKRRSTEDGQGGSKNPRLSCKYHPGLTNNYSEADCILPIEVKRNMDKAYKRYGNDVKFCNRCKAPNYKEEGHDCKSEDLAKLNKNSKINNEKRNKSIVPVFTNDNSEDGQQG
ncbi:hypothetical protein FB192DRAFT_1343595 [Mucor lusitanicus]|uniref:Uncharacterized protein n=1 Tax=Mucor circinelloides f. lusitanicus TaxID=29924 RepID=A0A8H4BEB2_MUCCL|nr:hypothetical protein FB192DRAFT_1343595 [Mucor lusitanicus]